MPRLRTDSELLGTVGAARHLRVHRSTLTSWRLKLQIKPTCVVQGPRGPLYKYSTADLDRFKVNIEYES